MKNVNLTFCLNNDGWSHNSEDRKNKYDQLDKALLSVLKTYWLF